MMQSRRKVAVICISLANGGAEKSSSMLTNMLVDKGFNVHTIIIKDEVIYDFSGKLFNLGAFKSENDNILKRIGHLKVLRRYLVNEGIDIVIDNRTRNKSLKEFIYLFYIYSGFNIIYVVRSAYLQNYFPKYRWLAKAMIKRSSKIVGVSKNIAVKVNALYQTNKALHIYNPVSKVSQSPINIPKPYILFLGRIDNHAKNFELLLDAYRLSALPDNQIKLKIYGHGPDETWLKHKIDLFNLSSDVELHSFNMEPEQILREAYFLVLTSNYEGFPRVLIESLSVGTPVVSVDCESGPNEIIFNEENGLLVEKGNATLLANAFNRFIFDKEMYNKCKNNAQASVRTYYQENIVMQWEQILNHI